jgi:cell division protein FtsL
MSKDTKGKDKSDIEKEFEEDLKEEEERRLPEEAELEGEFDEELEGEEWPEKKALDPFAEKFYELSGKTFKTKTELDTAVNEVLNEIERDYFFKGLLKKTGKSGKALLKKGLRTFKGVSAFQAAEGITQLVRGNLKATFSTLAKSGLKVRAGAAALPVLGTLGFEPGETNRDAWQNFANVCKESFDYLARNLDENADDPLEANKLASEAFGDALKRVKSELKSASEQRAKRVTGRRVVEKTGRRKGVSILAVIALGIACIVLAAGLVVAVFVVYPPMINDLQSQIAEKDNKISSFNNTISSLNSQVAGLTNLVANYASTLNQSDSEMAALNSQISELLNYLYLNASGILTLDQAITQNAGANTTIWNDIIEYAGYVAVDVQSSSNTTYVRMLYSSYGVNYDDTVTVKTSGTAAFPVLPGTIEIRVGNTDTVDSANATVTAIYYY